MTSITIRNSLPVTAPLFFFSFRPCYPLGSIRANRALFLISIPNWFVSRAMTSIRIRITIIIPQRISTSNFSPLFFFSIFKCFPLGSSRASYTFLLLIIPTWVGISAITSRIIRTSTSNTSSSFAFCICYPLGSSRARYTFLLILIPTWVGIRAITSIMIRISTPNISPSDAFSMC